MMQIIRNLVRNFVQKPNSKPLLGRWTIELCNAKLNHKIDLANEDNSGPFGSKLVKRKVKNESNLQQLMGSSDIRNNMLLVDNIHHLPTYIPAYQHTYLSAYKPIGK